MALRMVVHRSAVLLALVMVTALIGISTPAAPARADEGGSYARPTTEITTRDEGGSYARPSSETPTYDEGGSYLAPPSDETEAQEEDSGADKCVLDTTKKPKCKTRYVEQDYGDTARA